jgi:hypothetical protein
VWRAGAAAASDEWRNYSATCDILHQEPALGVYCLYRKRANESAGPMPDCPEASRVLQAHAAGPSARLALEVTFEGEKGGGRGVVGGGSSWATSCRARCASTAASRRCASSCSRQSCAPTRCAWRSTCAPASLGCVCAKAADAPASISSPPETATDKFSSIVRTGKPLNDYVFGQSAGTLCQPKIVAKTDFCVLTRQTSWQNIRYDQYLALSKRNAAAGWFGVTVVSKKIVS